MSLRGSSSSYAARPYERARPHHYENPIDDLRRIPLAESDPAAFRTRLMLARIDRGGTLHLTSAPHPLLSFQEMAARRSDPSNLELSAAHIHRQLVSASGVSLSNVGVSVAVEVTIGVRRFALLVEQGLSCHYKLISGYCDVGAAAPLSSNPARELFATACRELAEELIIGRIHNGRVIAAPLTVEPLPSLSDPRAPFAPSFPPYTSNFEIDTAGSPRDLKINERPSYLAGTFESTGLVIDGTPIEACFYIDRRYRSGQVVFSYKLDLDQCALSLLHAEDRHCSERQVLQSELHPDGVVLAEIAPNGTLNGDFFTFYEGMLVPLARDKRTRLSEIFTTCSGNPGIIDRGAIPFSEYLLNQQGVQSPA